jgi:hypothetical protein
MSFEQRDNSGSICSRTIARRKRRIPTTLGPRRSPAIDFYISAWLRGANGKKYMSLAFKVKEPKQEQAAPAISGNSFDDDMSSIPF